MGRRAKSSKDRAEAKRLLARKSSKDDGPKIHDPDKRLAEALAQLQTRDRELAAAQEQQAATAEILKVISSSPSDVQPVFDAIVRSAVQLCDGVFSIVGRFDGEHIHFGAEYNFSPKALAAYRRWFPRRAADDRLAG